MEFYDHDSLYYVFYEVIRLHYYRTHMLLDKTGVYPGQPPMLFALYIKDGQSQKQLANKLRIKPATITVMLNRMERAELLERRQDKEDQRVSRVYITKLGKEMCKEVHKTMGKIDSECFKNFTLDEQVIIRRLLMQMRDNLMDVCAEKGDCNK